MDIVGKTFESNHYGEFEVLELDHKDNNYKKYMRIKFKETGAEIVARYDNIKRGKVKDPQQPHHNIKDLTGQTFETNNCGKLDVMEYSDRIDGTTYFKVKFHESGYEMEVSSQRIQNGNVHDPYYPQLGGIACKGHAAKYKHEKLYNEWVRLLKAFYPGTFQFMNSARTFDVPDLCDRLLCFEYFVEDATELDGYDGDKLSEIEIAVKKDGDDVISKENLIWD